MKVRWILRGSKKAIQELEDKIILYGDGSTTLIKTEELVGKRFIKTWEADK